MKEYRVRMYDPMGFVMIECNIVARSPLIAQRLAKDYVRHFWRFEYAPGDYKSSEFDNLVIHSVRVAS